LERKYYGQGVTELIDVFKAEVEKVNPDLMICDFVSAFGTHSADELGIPCMIHAPAPFIVC
jgi:hypothetical protein